MKKLSTLLLFGLLATAGCSTIVGTRDADGKLTIASHRFFWTSEGIAFSLTDTNGLTTSLAVAKSSTDTSAINAVFTGLQAIGVQAVK